MTASPALERSAAAKGSSKLLSPVDNDLVPVPDAKALVWLVCAPTSTLSTADPTVKLYVYVPDANPDTVELSTVRSVKDESLLCLYIFNVYKSYRK